MAPVYPPIMLGTVLDVDDVVISAGGDVRQAVFVECPTLAAGRRLGPLLSSVPGLVKGESVIVATVGYARDNVAIIARTESRFPRIDDIATLRAELDGRLRVERGQEIDETLDVHAQSLAGQADQIALHDQRIDRNAADTDALRRSVADVRRAAALAGSAADSAAQAAASTLATMRTAVYGGPNRTKAPEARLVFNGTQTTLNQGADWVCGAGFVTDTTVDSGDNMVSISGETGAPRTITVPIAGEYLLTGLVRCRLPVAGQYLNLALIRNGLGARAANIVCLAEATTGSANNVTVSFARQVRLNAQDYLQATFAVLGGTNFILLGPELPQATHYFGARWLNA